MSPNRDLRSHLVVYYSRTGATRQAASTLAEILGADLLEIRTSRRYRAGTRGYALAALDAIFGREPEIRFLGAVPEFSRYKCVIVASPVWFSSVSPPVRSFLKHHRTSIGHLALVLTHGGSGATRAFTQMSEIAGITPIARLAIQDQDLRTGLDAPEIKVKLDTFVREAGFAPERVSPSLSHLPKTGGRTSKAG
jgi:flavodoxin